jgi:molybdate transport system substrate-binding protein
MVGSATGFLCLLMLVGMARADTKVLCANGMKGVMEELGPRFERRTGQKLAISFGTLGVILQRIEGGESADLALIPAQGVERLVKSGKVDVSTAAVIARSGIGVIVRKSAPKPDISTAEALKETLLSASSVTYLDPATGGTSGTHFAKVLDRLAIAAALKPKIVLHKDAHEAGALVADGKAEIGINLIQELMPLPGVDVVGPLPGDLQKKLVFTAAVLSGAQDLASAKALIAFLRTPDAAAIIAARGLDPR